MNEQGRGFGGSSKQLAIPAASASEVVAVAEIGAVRLGIISKLGKRLTVCAIAAALCFLVSGCAYFRPEVDEAARWKELEIIRQQEAFKKTFMGGLMDAVVKSAISATNDHE